MGDPVPGKIVHFAININTELGVVVSNASGYATYNYVADIADDGENMNIAYVGD